MRSGSFRRFAVLLALSVGLAGPTLGRGARQENDPPLGSRPVLAVTALGLDAVVFGARLNNPTVSANGRPTKHGWPPAIASVGWLVVVAAPGWSRARRARHTDVADQIAGRLRPARAPPLLPLVLA